MYPVALALAAFTGLPAGSMPMQGLLLPGHTESGADTWILGDPGRNAPLTTLDDPETSATDENLEDFPVLDDAPHVVLIGCDLGLSGGFTPDSWSREVWLGAPPPRIVDNGHIDRQGVWVAYEQIPRRPGRPESYAAYRYPLALAPVVSGYDLDKPDAEQRRGRMKAVGHGGVDLVAEIGAPISMIRLEHQIGDAEVLYVGWLYGKTVVTRHVVREGGVGRDYLLIFGHLDRAGEDVRRGRRLREGATVGFVGNSDSPELIHLHLEARRVRDGVDTWRLPGDALHAREFSIVSDPRNVLPLAAPPPRTPRCSPRLAPRARRYWLGDAMMLSLGDGALR
jgi:hypothetical protein